MSRKRPTKRALKFVEHAALTFVCAVALGHAWAQEARATPTPAEDTGVWYVLDQVIVPLLLLILGVLGASRFLRSAAEVKLGTDDGGRWKGWMRSKSKWSKPYGGASREARVSGWQAEAAAAVQAFYFALEGDGASGDAVEYGAEVQLVFNYAVPPRSALARVKAKLVEIAVKREPHVDLGVSVTASGFRLSDGVWFKVAKFRRGVLADPVQFPLVASRTPVADPFFFITLSLYGCPLYQFPIKVRLVESLDDVQDFEESVRTIDLDLDEVIAAERLTMTPRGQGHD